MADTSTNISTAVAAIAAKHTDPPSVSTVEAPVPNKIEAALLDARAAAAMCGISRSLWLALHNSGRIPLPVRLGRRVLWRREELLNWIRAGCPARQIWHAGSRPRQGYMAQEGGRS